jgi:hypothetical protein
MTHKTISILIVGAIVVSVLALAYEPDPTPASARTYPSYATLYEQVSNDRYLSLYRKADLSEQGNMLDAAGSECDGRLYEDFSCDTSEREAVARSESWQRFRDDDSKELARIYAANSEGAQVDSALPDEEHAAVDPPSGDPMELAVSYDGMRQADLQAAIELYSGADTKFTRTPVEIRQTTPEYADLLMWDEPGLTDARGREVCGAWSPNQGIALGTDLINSGKCSGPDVVAHEIAHAIGLYPHSADVNRVPNL